MDIEEEKISNHLCGKETSQSLLWSYDLKSFQYNWEDGESF